MTDRKTEEVNKSSPSWCSVSSGGANISTALSETTTIAPIDGSIRPNLTPQYNMPNGIGNEASRFNRGGPRPRPTFATPSFPMLSGQGCQYGQYPFVRHPYSPLPFYHAPRYNAPIFYPHARMPPPRFPTHAHVSMVRPPQPGSQRPSGRPPVVYGPPPPPPDVQIQRQMEYYFSKDNLVKDMHLRQLMDAQGWVPLASVATFPKLEKLAKNTKYENLNNMLELMHRSDLVEVKDDKIRPRKEWEKWILPGNPINNEEASSSGTSAQPAVEDQ